MSHFHPICLLIIAATLPSIPALAQRPVAKTGSCAESHGSQSKTLFDYRAGKDLRLYNLVPGVYATPRLGGPKDVELQQEARDKAYADAFSRIGQLGLSYDRARDSYLKGYHELRARNDQSILHQDIKIYREWEIMDWDECKYTYKVELAVPKFPGLGAELEQALRQTLKLDLESGRKTKKPFEINLSEMVDRLLKDPSFREKLLKKWTDERFREDLRYKDDDTQIFMGHVSRTAIEIKAYPKGQYRVNSIIAAIVKNTVLPAAEFYIHQYKDVTIECEGFTDQLAITGGIAYTGDAKLTTAGTSIIITPPVKSTAAPPPSATIRSNDQLSVARAYEGIAALQSALGDKIQNSGLTLRYSGQGAVQAPKADNPASRKIVFRISYDRPRG